MSASQTNGRMGRPLAVLCGVAASLLIGCSSKVEPPLPQGPPVALAVSINAVMVALVDHAAHVLWDVEKDGHAPKTDAEWTEIEHHAIQLSASGVVVALGGTGKLDAGWVKTPAWTKRAQELTDSALAALSAARAKDLGALVKANGRLVESCEGCHREFKPDVPTEGIMHPH
jgi:Cytochrome C'